MNNILAQIYATSETTKEKVVSLDDTVSKLFKIEEKEYKEDQKAIKDKDKKRRKKLQEEKRAAGDKKSLFGKLPEKQKKKEKKTIVDILKDSLLGIGKGLLGALGGVGSLLGGALTTAFGSLGLGSLIGGAVAAMGPALIVAIKAAAIAAAAGLAVKAANSAAGDIARNRAGFGTTKGGVKFDATDVAGLREKQRNFFKQLPGYDGSFDASQEARIGKFYEVDTAMAEAKKNKDKAKTLEEKIEKGDLDERRLKNIKAELKSAKRLQSEFEEKATELFSELQIADSDLVQLQINAGRRSLDALPKGHDKSSYSPRPLGTGLISEFDTVEYGDGNVVKRQRGGLIPTLLEPGEKVFLPGQWGKGIQDLNRDVPRFQVGGVVQDSHPHTGAGYSPGKDAQGRPAIFSKGAAEAFAEMIKASQGTVRTGAINSSKRSPSYNAKVGGVDGSNHLTGNAVDVQSGSPTWSWMKANGSQYGWKFNNYLGPDGWHFDYKGASKNEGADDVVAQTDAEGNSTQGILGSNFGSDEQLRALGPLGGVLAGLREGIQGIGQDALGALGLGGASGGILGGLFGGGDSTQSGGNFDLSSVSANGPFGKSSLISALDSAGITNKNERAMFLSQMHHESGGFRFREEIHDGSDYEGRSDLGNTQPGDGKRFKGRGYVQLTGRSNYKQYGSIVGVDLLSNPEKAADPSIAAKIALAYWDKRVDRRAAQAGDVGTVTYNINGGYNHLSERESLYREYSQKGYQTGGMVSLSGNHTSHTNFMSANSDYSDSMISDANPVPLVVYENQPGPTVVANNATHQLPPNLPDGPSTVQAAEYLYNLNFGGSF